MGLQQIEGLDEKADTVSYGFFNQLVDILTSSSNRRAYATHLSLSATQLTSQEP